MFVGPSYRGCSAVIKTTVPGRRTPASARQRRIDAGDEATALIQSNKQKPEIFDEPYTGMQSESGGVLGMLEVIASDFARARCGLVTEN